MFNLKNYFNKDNLIIIGTRKLYITYIKKKSLNQDANFAF